jgi:Flp pilus assembly protein TadG
MFCQHHDLRKPVQAPAVARRGRKRTGAFLVEFAVVAPMMFLLMLATFEFGRAFMVVELLTEGARIGCRGATINGTWYPGAIIEGTTSAQIRNAVTTYLSSVGINGDTAGVIVNDQPINTVEAANQPAYTEMTVQVTVPVSAVSWVPNPLFTSGTLKGQFTMRRE